MTPYWCCRGWQVSWVGGVALWASFWGLALLSVRPQCWGEAAAWYSSQLSMWVATQVNEGTVPAIKAILHSCCVTLFSLCHLYLSLCVWSGEEEVPVGVVGVVVLGDCPDVLSHCAVRARNCKIPVVACPRYASAHTRLLAPHCGSQWQGSGRLVGHVDLAHLHANTSLSGALTLSLVYVCVCLEVQQ